MNDDTVYEKMRDIIVEYLGVDVNEVTPRAAITNDLGADSLDLVELAIALEEAFEVEFEDEEIGEVRTVEQLFQLITRKLSQA